MFVVPTISPAGVETSASPTKGRTFQAPTGLAPSGYQTLVDPSTTYEEKMTIYPFEVRYVLPDQ